MATVQNAQIRQHFIRMGMPKKEIDSIMRDNVIMQKTHIFINKWGLSSIRVDHHVPATYTTRKLDLLRKYSSHRINQSCNQIYP